MHEEPIPGNVVGYLKKDGVETFKVELGEDLHGADPDARHFGCFVKLPGGSAPQPYSFLSPGFSNPTAAQMQSSVGPPSARDILWLRRWASDAKDRQLTADVFVSATKEAPGQQYRVVALLPAQLRSSADLLAELHKALAAEFSDAALGYLFRKQANVKSRGLLDDTSPLLGHNEWSEVMRLSSGYGHIELALRHNDKLRVMPDPKRRLIKLSELSSPELTRHPWHKMLAALPDSQAPATEPLAQAAPAEFYYVRARNFSALQALLDEAETWLTPAFHLMESRGRRYDLSARYRTQLALPKSELLRLFGPRLIESLAIVGSDPFLRQGSDVTVIVATKSQSGFAAALAVQRSRVAEGHPFTVTQSEHHGVKLVLCQSADGLVRQWTAELELKSPPGQDRAMPLTLISNSKGAITRVIDAALGLTPQLADEPDFQYMLARDADVPAPVLGYAGERFVLKAVTPAQRVLDARRQLARAELMLVSEGALAFGIERGRPPRDLKELLKSPWLDRAALQHLDGKRIEFVPGSAPRSAWGTPEQLTPLIDLPPVRRVTPGEREAYQRFAQRYALQWRERVDPIALRLQVEQRGEQRRILAHLRVLPIARTRDYRSLLLMAGDKKVKGGVALPALQASLGIGQRAGIRRMLSGEGRSFFGNKLKFDWLGDEVSLGLADHPDVAHTLKDANQAPELPASAHTRTKAEISLLVGLPLYVALDIKSRAGAAVVLTMFRKLLKDVISKSAEWGEHSMYRKTPIIRVSVDQVQVFYALTERRFTASFSLPTLKRLLDAEFDAKPEAAQAVRASAGQLTIDLQPEQKSGLLTALTWLIEHEQRLSADKTRDEARTVLLGTQAPDAEQVTRLSMAYLGYLPSTPDGAAYRLGATGIEDPARGTPHAPTWPQQPVKGSPLSKLLPGLKAIRSTVAFDAEPNNPGLRSLRTELVIERRLRATPD